MDIIRENAKVSTFDNVYCELLENIRNNGTLIENRTGVDTYTIGTAFFTLKDIENNFPILETKKTVIKNALSEILWIHQVQSNNVNWLKSRKNNIWNEWMIDEDGIYRIYEPNGKFIEKEVEVVDVYGNNVQDKYLNTLKTTSKIEGKTIKKAIYFGEKYAYTIGEAYGFINSITKDPQDVLKTIKNEPTSRRLIIDLRKKEHLKFATLEPCVWSCEFRVIEDKLNLFVHQRSADVPIGLPFNVSQYAALLKMFAKVSNLKAGTLSYSINDAHIYINQIDAINKQLLNYANMKYFESFISNNTDNRIIEYYRSLISYRETIQKYMINNPSKNDVMSQYEELDLKIKALELLLNRQKPTLDIADKDNFFRINNEINNDPIYLKENPTGNKDLVLKNYSSMPFIKMPVTQ